MEGLYLCDGGGRFAIGVCDLAMKGGMQDIEGAAGGYVESSLTSESEPCGRSTFLCCRGIFLIKVDEGVSETN